MNFCSHNFGSPETTVNCCLAMIINSVGVFKLGEVPEGAQMTGASSDDDKSVSSDESEIESDEEEREKR